MKVAQLLYVRGPDRRRKDGQRQAARFPGQRMGGLPGLLLALVTGWILAWSGARAGAASVTLAWDASTETNLAGYRILYGPASRQYDRTNNVGLTTTATVSNLLAAATNYFAVIAYDTTGLESEPSNEVAYPEVVRVLTIRSVPVPGAFIAVSPPDKDGRAGGGATNLTRRFSHGTVVTLTASATLEDLNLAGWLRNDPVPTPGETITVEMTEDVVLTAEYNSPPTISISATAGPNLLPDGSVTINATAQDSDGTVTRVEFFAGAETLGEDDTFPFSIVWNNVPAGNHTLTARAWDNAGASTISGPVDISVGSSNPPPAANNSPLVVLTYPFDGATFTGPTNLLLNAYAVDFDGTIRTVEFFAGNTRLGEDTTRPYELIWSNAPPGRYALEAIATDNLGASSNSTALLPVTVTITSPNRPAILVEPQGQSTFVGAPVTLSVQATGAEPLSYRWRRKGTNVTDSTKVRGSTTPVLSFASVSQSQGGQYTVVVSNSFGAVTSQVAQLRIARFPPQKLTVNASNALNTPMIVVPQDTKGRDDNITPFTFEYVTNSVVILTAPPVSDSFHFVQWLQNGAPHTNAPTAVVTMDGDRTMTAVYEPGLEAPAVGDVPLSLGISRRTTGQLRVLVYGADGTSLEPQRVTRAGIFSAPQLPYPASQWLKIAAPSVPTNGIGEYFLPQGPLLPQRYFFLIEQP